MKSLNVLSLCDGMSCGHIALEQTGFKVNNLTEKESANVLGDGWAVPVISHIFSFMNF